MVGVGAGAVGLVEEDHAGGGEGGGDLVEEGGDESAEVVADGPAQLAGERAGGRQQAWVGVLLSAQVAQQAAGDDGLAGAGAAGDDDDALPSLVLGVGDGVQDFLAGQVLVPDEGEGVPSLDDVACPGQQRR